MYNLHNAMRIDVLHALCKKQLICMCVCAWARACVCVFVCVSMCVCKNCISLQCSGEWCPSPRWYPVSPKFHLWHIWSTRPILCLFTPVNAHVYLCLCDCVCVFLCICNYVFFTHIIAHLCVFLCLCNSGFFLPSKGLCVFVLYVPISTLYVTQLCLLCIMWHDC